MPKDLDKPTPAVEEMRKDWCVIDALLGGTRAMRERVDLMPQWPLEEVGPYSMRVECATLFPAYNRTVQTLTGKPFSKPIKIGDDIPEDIVKWFDDVDLQGRNLDAFAAGVMESTLAYGLGGIFVEMPVRGADLGPSKADEAAAGLRPYMVQIRANQIIGWRAAYKPNLGWALTQLRILEEVDVEEGDYEVVTVKQVRVLTIGGWSTFRPSKGADNSQWDLVASGVTTLEYIPFIPTYGQRLGFMCAKPPLLEMAYMNVKHWQSQSDQDHILHVARVPILVATGISDGDFELPVGASTCVNLKDVGSTLQYVEHTGKAIEAGRTSLEDLKEEMRQAGAELLVIGKRNEVTATQVASENELGTCAMQRIAQGVEDALDAAIQIMADYMLLGEGGSLTLFNDFGVGSLTDASAQMLQTMATAGQLSDQTLYNEMQRRGILSPDLDWEDEKELLDAQGPPPGMAGLDPLTGLPLAPPPEPVEPNPDPAKKQPVKKPVGAL